ncbi:MAG: DNA polymerase/3'-5' exonuclease PolX [bacterium]|nr:MAG: DNA polymerase/3'-5' exonuclease PolX [bacterium]
MTNQTIAQLLGEISKYLLLKDDNPFKVKAFANAAQVLRDLNEDIRELAGEGSLQNIKGLGASTQKLILEYIQSGQILYHKELKDAFPENILTLFKISGLGPKKMKFLYDQLNISNIKELEYACHENRLMELKGFGIKSQEKILKEIHNIYKNAGHFLLSTASTLTHQIVDHLNEAPGVIHVSPVGEIRRRNEIISCVNILISTSMHRETVSHISQFPGINRIIEADESEILIQSLSGLKVSIKIVPEELFYIHQFIDTASQKHLQQVKKHALQQDIKLSHDGISKNGEHVHCPDEKSIYETLQMSWIAPELREGLGEVEAALNDSLPSLITHKSIRGIFHNHTTWSDGSASIEKMALTAKDFSLQYIGISDHSKSAVYAGGLNEEELLEQMDEIDRLNETLSGITILKGTEVDILSDGSLDLDDSVLAQCDFVIASVHSQFNMDSKTMTRRLVRAMENPYVTMIGHPTGRLLLGRAGYQFDVDLFLETAKRHHKVLELNANPHRLDLNWLTLRKAKDMGLKVSINPDAHRPEGIYYLQYGIDTARRAWLTDEDCLNTLSLNDVRDALKI